MRLVALAALAVLALGTAGAGADARPSACQRVVPSDRAPSWSPDNDSIAFVRRGGSCSWENALYVILYGGEPLRLATGGGEHPPAWSPDSTRLAFPSHGWLTVVSVRGRGLDQLARGGRAPAWSPDGRRLAFTLGRQLRVVGVDGSDERVLATALATGTEPGWSPSGDELLYGGQDGEIHVVDVDSGTDRIVAGHPSWDADPVWAGTTGAILFVSARTGSQQLWRLARERTLRQETFEPGVTRSPATSRDGSALAFVREGGRRAGLHYWSREGRTIHPVSRDSVVGGRPALSPDGWSLAWAARGRCGRLGIHLHMPDAGPRYERRRTNSCEFSGTKGRDTMRGTPWGDVIDSGGGNDLVLTRDSHRDSVRCGTGFDRVVADRKDAIARDCERVQRP